MPKIKILGWFYAGLGGLGLLIGLGLCIGLLFDIDPRSLPALEFVGPLFLMLALVSLAPGLIGGVGLIAGQSWARIPVVIASLPLLFFFPIGTAVSLFAFWVLYDDEKQIAAAPPPASTPAPPSGRFKAAVQQEFGRMSGVLLAMAGVGAGFIVVLGAGFHMNHQQAPAFIDASFSPAIVVLVLITLFVAWRFYAAR